jgi:DNA-binding NtrC family response regulator
MYVSRKKQLNPHVGSESRDIRVNTALPESLLTNGFVNNCGRLFGPSEQFEADIVEVGPEGSLVMTIADKEREIIEAALAECGGRVAGPKGAAAKLKIPRQTLDSKIACLNIDKRRFQTLTCLSRLPETSSFASAITVEGTTASL